MSNYSIFIALIPRRLYLMNNNKAIASYPVAIGKPATPTPVGNFRIINKIFQPGGILGTRWMQFTPQQHGVHGTNKPWLIGQAVSHGCVRMHNQDVEQVYNKVRIGDQIVIRQNKMQEL